MTTNHTLIVNLLRNLGTQREIEQYLSAFTSVESARFAVVKVGGAILASQLDELASSLAFLHGVGLRPVIVHGGGPQLTAALRERGVRSEWIDGERITTPETLETARRVFPRIATTLADALDRQGVKARPISSGIFDVQRSAVPSLGLVGEITGVHLESIHATIQAGYLPILSSLGETRDGQILNINADVAVRELARAITPRKVVFLTSTGGLLDPSGAVVPAINLAEDYDRMMRDAHVEGGMALKLREIRNLLEDLPEQSSVSITSPDHLAEELFTHRGHGTLVRRGVQITTMDTLDEADGPRLRRLLEQAFGRRLHDNYFQQRPIERLFVAGDYTAVAILTGNAPATYLDKFAVTAEAQGAGIGASLWRRLVEETPRLFWRSRADNPINPWYFQRADGTHRDERWVVFWRGVHDRDTIERCIDYALTLEPSFVSHNITDHEPVLAK